MAKFINRTGATKLSKGVEDVNVTLSDDTPLVDRPEHMVDTLNENVEDIKEAEELAIASVEAFGGIVSLYAVGKQSLNNGGLNKTGIMLLDIGSKEILKRITDTPENKLYSSLEAFGGASSREKATTFSLEGLANSISEWFKNIINFLMSIGDKIKGVIVKMVNSAGRLKKAIANTKAKADALSTTSTPTAKNYEDESVATALHIQGTVPASNGLLTHANSVVELIKVINAGYTKNTSSDSIGKITEFVGNFTDKAKVKEAINQFQSLITSFEFPNFTDDKHKDKRKVSDGTKYNIQSLPEMLGGKTIWRATPLPALLSSLEKFGLEAMDDHGNEINTDTNKDKSTDNKDTPTTETKDFSAAKESLKAQIGITEFDPEFKKDSIKKSIVYFEKADIIKVMDVLESPMDTITNLNNAIVKGEEKRRKLTDAAKKASSTNISDEDVNVKANATLAVDLLKASAVQLDSFPVQAIGYIMNTIKNLISHAEKSMNLYK